MSRALGGGGGVGGGQLNLTNWESLPGSSRHNNMDKKVSPATADYHLDNPTHTHSLKGSGQ